MIKKIWHISDTHGYHDLLVIPENIDIVIHSGDFTNYKDLYRNETETSSFIRWYSGLLIPTKILVAGNHDTYVSRYTEDFRKICQTENIIYLQDEFLQIEGINFYGSPYTPSYGDWHFQKSRFKMDNIWKQIPVETDILVVHGPPKGILDLSYDKTHRLDQNGDRALKNNVIRVQPKMCLFGHIHSNEDIVNAGILKLAEHNILYSNGSVITHGKLNQLTSNGNIIDYDVV
jgi:Icc-related predicted phosphoesterase